MVKVDVSRSLSKVAFRGSPGSIFGGILASIWEQKAQLYSTWGALGCQLGVKMGASVLRSFFEVFVCPPEIREFGLAPL